MAAADRRGVRGERRGALRLRQQPPPPLGALRASLLSAPVALRTTDRRRLLYAHAQREHLVRGLLRRRRREQLFVRAQQHHRLLLLLLLLHWLRAGRAETRHGLLLQHLQIQQRACGSKVC